MQIAKRALAQALVMLVLFAVAVAGVNLLAYVVLVVLPDSAVIAGVFGVAAYYAGRELYYE